MRLPLLAVAMLFAMACTERHEIRLSGRDDDMGDNLWEDYLRGDTVQLYAREGRVEGDPSAPASAVSPDAYTWTSLNPAVVQVIGRGLLVMKGTGPAELTVRGPHVTRHFTVWSYPPDAKVRLAPRDTTLNVGEIMTLTIIVLDGAGNVMQTDAQRQAGYSVSFGSNISGQVLMPVGNDARQWRAERSGVVDIRGGISLFKRFGLNDSTRVTVR